MGLGSRDGRLGSVLITGGKMKYVARIDVVFNVVMDDGDILITSRYAGSFVNTLRENQPKYIEDVYVTSIERLADE